MKKRGDKMIKKENRIIWLDDPKKYEYLRKSKIYRCSPRMPSETTLKKQMKSLYKLVGCESPTKMGDRLFESTIYWLKDYDRGCPNQFKENGYGKTSLMPSEAILVKKLISN